MHPYTFPRSCAFIALSFSVCVAVGCGDDEDAASTSTTTTSTTSTPTTSAGTGGATGTGGSSTTTSTTTASTTTTGAGGNGGGGPTGVSFTLDFAGTGYDAAAGDTVVFGVIDGFDAVLFSESITVPGSGEFDESWTVQTSYTEPSLGVELHFYIDSNASGDCENDLDEPWVVPIDWSTDGQVVSLSKNYSDTDYDNRACLFPIEP